MNIVTRNLLRLLRAGVFDYEESVEPMSAWKWRRVYEVCVEQGVVCQALTGITRLQNQFFLQIPSEQMEAWQKSRAEQSSKTPTATDEDSRSVLTNRQNRHAYKGIVKQAELFPGETALINDAIRVAHHIIGDGLFLAPLLQMAQTYRDCDTFDAEVYARYLHQLHMERMAHLESSLLLLLDPHPYEDIASLPCPPLTDDSAAQLMFDALFDRRRGRGGQLHFTQNGNDIFIHTSNSRAMLWQASRSAQYFRYYPSESITTLLYSFARSLTDIEE